MKIILQSIAAVVVGLAVGGCVNMALVVLGPRIIPPPAGVDVMDVKSISASMHLFEPKHFVFPFLAHALGTLAGAIVAFLIAVKNRSLFSYAVGALFLAGGIAAVAMIPAPTWFIALDLLVAYLPMAFIGALLGSRIARRAAAAPSPTK